jgi:hypothetical protein
VEIKKNFLSIGEFYRKFLNYLSSKRLHVSHLVDDAIVHGAELVQNAGHGPFRRFVVKVRVQQIRSLQRGGATHINFEKISVAGYGSDWIRIGFWSAGSGSRRAKKPKKTEKNWEILCFVVLNALF